MSKQTKQRVLSRRELMRTGSLGLAGLTLGCAPRASENLDLNDPWDRLTALAKLRGDISGKTVMWWMKGVRYGVVDNEIRPLFNMLIGSFQRMWSIPGKGFGVNMLEMGYFTDLETGEVLDTFVNPYTGKEVEVPEQQLGPFPVLMRPTGVVLPDLPMFGDIDLKTKVGPAIVSGDDVWIRDDSSVNVDSDHPMMGKHIYNELVTYRGSLSELNDPDVTSAAADISFTSVTSWREWFEAEDVGGHTTARANGNKISRIEDFPPEYLAAARERHSDLIADPDAVLDASPPMQMPEDA